MGLNLETSIIPPCRDTQPPQLPRNITLRNSSSASFRLSPSRPIAATPRRHRRVVSGRARYQEHVHYHKSWCGERSYNVGAKNARGNSQPSIEKTVRRRFPPSFPLRRPTLNDDDATTTADDYEGFGREYARAQSLVVESLPASAAQGAAQFPSFA